MRKISEFKEKDNTLLKGETLGMFVDIDKDPKKEEGNSDLAKDKNQGIVNLHNYLFLTTSQPKSHKIILKVAFKPTINALYLSTGVNREPHDNPKVIWEQARNTCDQYSRSLTGNFRLITQSYIDKNILSNTSVRPAKSTGMRGIVGW